MKRTGTKTKEGGRGWEQGGGGVGEKKEKKEEERTLAEASMI